MMVPAVDGDFRACFRVSGSTRESDNGQGMRPGRACAISIVSIRTSAAARADAPVPVFELRTVAAAAVRRARHVHSLTDARCHLPGGGLEGARVCLARGPRWRSGRLDRTLQHHVLLGEPLRRRQVERHAGAQDGHRELREGRRQELPHHQRHHRGPPLPDVHGAISGAIPRRGRAAQEDAQPVQVRRRRRRLAVYGDARRRHRQNPTEGQRGRRRRQLLQLGQKAQARRRRLAGRERRPAGRRRRRRRGGSRRRGGGRRRGRRSGDGGRHRLALCRRRRHPSPNGPRAAHGAQQQDRRHGGAHRLLLHPVDVGEAAAQGAAQGGGAEAGQGGAARRHLHPHPRLLRGDPLRARQGGRPRRRPARARCAAPGAAAGWPATRGPLPPRSREVRRAIAGAASAARRWWP